VRVEGGAEHIIENQCVRGLGADMPYTDHHIPFDRQQRIYRLHLARSLSPADGDAKCCGISITHSRRVRERCAIGKLAWLEDAPVLREFSFTATVFLVTSKCGEFNDWSGNPRELPRTRLLSWDQIRQLSEDGIEFGSHTMTHPELTSVSQDASAIEIARSKRVIEDAIGKPVVSFAYPFGRFTSSVRRLVEENYATACSTNLGRVRPTSDMHALERIDAYYLSNPRSLEKLESRWMDSYFSFRQALRNVRGAMRNYPGALSSARCN
jgi:hypothetical protein